MNKKTKLLLGVAVVGVGGYLLWKSRQPAKKNFADPIPMSRLPFLTTGSYLMQGGDRIQVDGVKFRFYDNGRWGGWLNKADYEPAQ